MLWNTITYANRESCHEINLSIRGDAYLINETLSLRSTKEERFLISWATCDRVGFLCTQAKADPCFFVRSVGRPGVHLFSAILNDVTISLRKGCCLVNDVTISLRKGCCLVLRSLSDVRERGCSLVNKLYCPFIACLIGKLFGLCCWTVS